MRKLIMLVCIGVACYFGFQSLFKHDAPPADATVCGRLSKFMDAQLPDVLGPLVYRDEMGKYWSRKMPMTEIMQLVTMLNTEATNAAPKDRPRYQAAIAVCEALNNLMKEQQAAFVRFEASVQGLSRRGSTWSQIVERHNARWAEHSTLLLKGITSRYQQAAQTEAAALGAQSR